jgi:hypothetical protein
MDEKKIKKLTLFCMPLMLGFALFGSGILDKQDCVAMFALFDGHSIEFGMVRGLERYGSSPCAMLMAYLLALGLFPVYVLLWLFWGRLSDDFVLPTTKQVAWMIPTFIFGIFILLIRDIDDLSVRKRNQWMFLFSNPLIFWVFYIVPVVAFSAYIAGTIMIFCKKFN